MILLDEYEYIFEKKKKKKLYLNGYPNFVFVKLLKY